MGSGFPPGGWNGGEWGTAPPPGTGHCGCGTWTGGWGATGWGTGRRGAWMTGGLITGLGTGTWTGGTGIGATGGTTTGTGITGSIGGAAGTGGAAGAGTAGSGAGAGGFNGRGADIGCGRLIFGIAGAAWTGAGACCVGTMRFWLGVGRNATVPVVRMPMASAISSASTALMPTTAKPLPISRTGLRRGGSCS